MKRLVKKCMSNGCDDRARSRGLCWNCYQNCRNAVKAERTTWEKLESAGLSKKPRVLSEASRAIKKFCESGQAATPDAPTTRQDALKEVGVADPYKGAVPTLYESWKGLPSESEPGAESVPVESEPVEQEMKRVFGPQPATEQPKPPKVFRCPNDCASDCDTCEHSDCGGHCADEPLAEKKYPPIPERTLADVKDKTYAAVIRKHLGVSDVEQIPEGEPLDPNDSRPGLYETDAEYIIRIERRIQVDDAGRQFSLSRGNRVYGSPAQHSGEPMQQSTMAPSEYKAMEKRRADDAALGKALGHVPFKESSGTVPVRPHGMDIVLEGVEITPGHYVTSGVVPAECRGRALTLLEKAERAQLETGEDLQIDPPAETPSEDLDEDLSAAELFPSLCGPKTQAQAAADALPLPVAKDVEYVQTPVGIACRPKDNPSAEAPEPTTLPWERAENQQQL